MDSALCTRSSLWLWQSGGQVTETFNGIDNLNYDHLTIFIRPRPVQTSHTF